MTVSAEATLLRAAELELSLAVKLMRTRSDSRDDLPHSDLSQISTDGRRVRCVPKDYGSAFYPTDSVDTALRFLRNHAALDRIVSTDLDKVARAEKAERALSSRMRRAGMDDLFARKRDAITGVGIDRDGGLRARWRSNGAIVRVIWNPSIAQAFLDALPHFERVVARRESEMNRLVRGGSRLRSMLDRSRVPTVQVGAPPLDATEHAVREAEVTAGVEQLTDNLRDAVSALYDRLDGGLVEVGTAEPGIRAVVFDATGSAAGRGRRNAPVLLRNGLPVEVPRPGGRLDEADCEWAGWVVAECAAAMRKLDRQLAGRAARMDRILASGG